MTRGADKQGYDQVIVYDSYMSLRYKERPGANRAQEYNAPGMGGSDRLDIVEIILCLRRPELRPYAIKLVFT